MPENLNQTLTLEHFGDHHQAEVQIDPRSHQVQGGAILNFSDHGVVNLQVNPEGQVSGEFRHSGDTHLLQATADGDGQFSGSFADKQAGVAITLASGVAELAQGEIPTTGLIVVGDHHRTELSIDANGKLSGTLESQATDLASFRLEIREGQVAGGSLVHQGEGHETRLTLSQEGWAGTIAAGQGDRRWAVEVRQGSAGLSAVGNVEIRF